MAGTRSGGAASVMGRLLLATASAGAMAIATFTPTTAEAACSSPVFDGNLPAEFNFWGPASICAGVSAGTSITSALSTVNTAFLTQSSAFVAGGSAEVDKRQGGFWIRTIGGSLDVKARGVTTSTVGGLYLSDSKTDTSYAGFQVGLDFARLNFANGWNLFVGATAGYIGVKAEEKTGFGNYDFSVPFVGLYAAAGNGPFFADLQVRGDFYSIDVTNALIGVAGGGMDATGLSLTGSAGYRFDIGSFFVEPSASFVLSRTDVDSLAVPGSPVLGPNFGAVPAGTYHFSDVNSAAGRLGVRIGTTLLYESFALQPFAAASVWNEFAEDAKSSFVCTGCAFSINNEASRVGTYGQFSLGAAVQVLNTGVTSYIRADYRKGDHIEGFGLNAGFRYNF